MFVMFLLFQSNLYMQFQHIKKVLKIAFIEIFSRQKTLNKNPTDPSLCFACFMVCGQQDCHKSEKPRKLPVFSKNHGKPEKVREKLWKIEQVMEIFMWSNQHFLFFSFCLFWFLSLSASSVVLIIISFHRVLCDQGVSDFKFSNISVETDLITPLGVRFLIDLPLYSQLKKQKKISKKQTYFSNDWLSNADFKS